MDKKNTLLLTIIAVATLLVAVIGATFAYFTATAEAGTHEVQVTTPKAQTASIDNSTSIVSTTITGAQMEQLGVDTPYKAHDGANVKLSAQEKGQRFCYTAKLDYDGSAFSYSTGNNGSPKKPELKIVVKKDTLTFTKDITGAPKVEGKYLKVNSNALEESESQYINIMTSTAEGTSTVTNAWSIDLIFTNYTAFSQNNNADKTATAKLVLDPVDCPA